jgi:hypothetical protein
MRHTKTIATGILLAGLTFGSIPLRANWFPLRDGILLNGDQQTKLSNVFMANLVQCLGENAHLAGLVTGIQANLTGSPDLSTFIASKLIVVSKRDADRISVMKQASGTSFLSESKKKSDGVVNEAIRRTLVPENFPLWQSDQFSAGFDILWENVLGEIPEGYTIGDDTLERVAHYFRTVNMTGTLPSFVRKNLVVLRYLETPTMESLKSLMNGFLLLPGSSMVEKLSNYLANEISKSQEEIEEAVMAKCCTSCLGSAQKITQAALPVLKNVAGLAMVILDIVYLAGTL